MTAHLLNESTKINQTGTSHFFLFKINSAYKSNALLPLDVFHQVSENISKSSQFIDIYTALNPKLMNIFKDSQERFQCKQPKSEIDGIPISIKDNLCVQGMPTTCASRMLQGKCGSLTCRLLSKLFGCNCRKT